jgi:hypothetical protein
MRPLFPGLLLLAGLAGCTHDHSHEKVEAQPYIVELRDDVDVDAFIDEHYLEPATPLPLIHGFSAELRPATVDTLRADDRVERLTEDRPVDAL